MIYFCLFIILLVPVIRYDLCAKRGGENIWFYSSLFLLIMIAGLRYRVGGDTLVYMADFNSCPKLDEIKYFDFETARFNPLWYLFNALCRSINDSFTCFQIIHAVIVNCTFFHFFRKYCPRYYFSAILVWYVGYWCYFNMEILREVLCICILLWSTEWLLEKKLLRYYIFCIIALFIHYSAIVMTIFPLLYLIFRRPNWIFQLVLLFGVMCLTAMINLPSLIVSVFSLDDQLLTIIENYLQVDSRNLTGMLFEIFKYLPVLGIIWLRERNGMEDEFDFVPIVSCMVVFTGMATYLGVAGRFLNYCAPFFIITFVNTLYDFLTEQEWKSRNISALVTFSVLIVLTFNYSDYYLKDRSDVYPDTRSYSIFLPYHSVINPVVENKREGYVENLHDLSIFF